MLSGYTVMQSMDILWFEYRNGNTLLEFSVSDQEQANELMQSELARGRIQLLNYYKGISPRLTTKGSHMQTRWRTTGVPSAKAYIERVTMG